LSYNNLGDLGITKLCSFIRTSKNLKVLNVSACRFTNEGGHMLFSEIAHNAYALRTLNMSHNKFTSKNMDKLGYCILKGDLEVLDIT
jgi:Ran GTPase-activating protein (RanGAP) involved in mRNA processing and transport